METVVETEEVVSDGDDEEYGVCADGSIQRREWSRSFLTVWSLVLQLLGMWCGVNMRVAMDSGLYEVFPFKGERVKMSGALTVWFTFSFVCIIVAAVSHA